MQRHTYKMNKENAYMSLKLIRMTWNSFRGSMMTKHENPVIKLFKIDSLEVEENMKTMYNFNSKWIVPFVRMQLPFYYSF